MRVREATVYDLETLIALGELMHVESNYRSIIFSKDKTLVTGISIIADPMWCVRVCEGKDDEVIGMFVGYVSQFPFSYDLVASDFVLYVLPEYRGSTAALRLLGAYEAWAKSKEAKIINIGTTTGVNTDKVGEFYERLGFNRVGAVYRKEV